MVSRNLPFFIFLFGFGWLFLLLVLGGRGFEGESGGNSGGDGF